ncbi:hypothetical protein GCM10009122_26550 [Fulvivirga kasyanovii]
MRIFTHLALLVLGILSFGVGYAQTSVVVIDKINNPAGDYPVGSQVCISFDLHNIGPDATINDITVNYELPERLSFKTSGSSGIFSESAGLVSGVHSGSIAVGASVTYTMCFQIEEGACPGSTIGGGETCSAPEGSLTISGGSELSPGFLRFKEWSHWGVGGSEDVEADKISNYFPLGQLNPTSTCSSNTGTATSADIEFFYDNDNTSFDSKISSYSGNGDRITWEWYGIIVPDETTNYTFCGTAIDDGWAAWITDDFDPESGDVLDPTDMNLVGEEFQWNGGGTVNTPNFSLVCGRPYFFRIVVSSRNTCVNGANFGYSSITLAKTSASCTQAWGSMISENIATPLTLNLNCAPAQGNEQVTINEDSGLSVFDLVSNNTDPDGDPIAVSFPEGTTTTAGITITDNGNGTINYTPAANYFGQDTLFYTVCDNISVVNCVSDTLFITINPVNDEPSFTKGANQTVNEDAGSQTVTGWGTSLDNGASNESDQTLSFIVTNDNNGLFSVQPIIDANGVLTYTPAENANGTATVTVILKDNGGTSNGGDDTYETQTFTITISPINDAPVAFDDSNSVDEDNTLTLTAANGLLANDTDIDGDALTVTLFEVEGTTYPAGTTVNLSQGDLTVNLDGSYSFIPASDYNGTLPEVTYTVSDDVLTDEGSLTISISPVNDEPVAIDDSKSTVENTTLTVSADNGILANDTDVDGDALTITEFEVGGTTYPAGTTANLTEGSLTINGDGSYTFVPATDYTGTVPQITYTVSDGHVTDEGTLTINVTEIANNAPVAVDDTNSVDEGSTLSVSAANGVLANDTDADGDVLSVSQFEVDGQTFPAGTTANLTQGDLTVNADGSYTFVPAENFSGSVPQVTYTVGDGLDSDEGTLDIVVNPVNKAPVAEDGTIEVENGETVTGTIAPLGTDPDGDALTFGLVTTPSNGTLVLNGDGGYTYTAPENFSGTITFVYEVCDGTVCTQATVTITVTSDDTDNDGIPDDVEGTGDTDGDGTPDFQDTDSDNDGIPDDVEAGDDGNNPVDTDNDGTPDYLDEDSDNDGIPDSEEAGNDPTNPVDSDNDGLPDYRDPQDDTDAEVFINQQVSPDGDGVNDFWEIESIEQYPANNVKLYNRWGNLIFEQDGYNNADKVWTGNSNSGLLLLGDRLPSGTYFYVIDLGDGSALKSGYIVLKNN